MNFTLSIVPGDVAALESRLLAKLEAARGPVQARMTEAFYGIVMANFGSVGWDRPWTWQQLSPKYAKRVGRTFATLFVTGALKATVKADLNAATVTMGNTSSVPYALAHHHGHPGNFGWTQPGSGELPARRVFPLDEADQPTERSQATVMQAAYEALREAMQ